MSLDQAREDAVQLTAIGEMALKSANRINELVDRVESLQIYVASLAKLSKEDDASCEHLIVEDAKRFRVLVRVLLNQKDKLFPMLEGMFDPPPASLEEFRYLFDRAVNAAG